MFGTSVARMMDELAGRIGQLDGVVQSIAVTMRQLVRIAEETRAQVARFQAG